MIKENIIMKTKINYIQLLRLIVLSFILSLYPEVSLASVNDNVSYSQEFNQYKGSVVDSRSGTPLVFATLEVDGTNISTITNTEGEFLLKVPVSISSGTVSISFLGYKSKTVNLSVFKAEKTKIKLESSAIELSGVNISAPKDAEELVKKALRKKETNYFNDQTVMTAFYRETIKKRRKNVSLSEAVVNLYKQSYSSSRRDVVELFKARKSTDYTKLDTVALKLQGGPFSALYLDIMKYPEYIFSDGLIDLYDFSFDASTIVNNKEVYVVKFQQKAELQNQPLYYGKLFIDARTLALTSAVYNLNVENRVLASDVFVRKKPKDILVYPTEAAYRVDYREKDGKWYYGYGNVQLAFKVNRKRKIFNSSYRLTSEMAVTDWELNTSGETARPKDRLRPTIVISDEASGFSDPEFWGAYNVIEPEKSIESAINKIKRQLKKVKS